MYKLNIEGGQPLSPKSSAPMLSEVFIKLPRPQATKRVSSYQDNSDPSDSHRYGEPESNTLKVDSHFALFSGARTKNSSASLPYRTESEIISEWVRNLFQKRGLIGPQWEEKFGRKRRQVLRYAFNLVRDYEPRQMSGYLQTQSRHKTYARACNPLHVLGLEKMSEIVPKMATKSKQLAFSRILRFLAFQNVDRMGSSRQAKDSMAYSINPSQRAPSRNVADLKLVLNYASRQEYDIVNINANSRNLKQVHSSKHLPIVDNQYALAPVAAPVSPFGQTETFRHEEEKLRSPRNSRQLMRGSHGLTTSRESQRNQMHNRVFNDPRYELIKLKQSQYIYSNTPPSPQPHHGINTAPYQMNHESRHLNSQHNLNHVVNRPNRPEEPRSSNHFRPHSHNPFKTTNQSSEKSIEREAQKHPDSRSRAVSASNNIKISFNGHLQYQNQSKKETVPDYKGELQQMQAKGELQQMQAQSKNMYKLGTLENRQMRQSYQMNSLNNQLLPAQDYPRTPNLFYSPNPAVCSSPITPKALHSPVAKGYLSPPMTPTGHGQYSPGAHQPLGRQFKKVQRGEKRCHNGQNDYNLRKRQKLVVTSMSRRKH